VLKMEIDIGKFLEQELLRVYDGLSNGHIKAIDLRVGKDEKGLTITLDDVILVQTRILDTKKVK